MEGDHDDADTTYILTCIKGTYDRKNRQDVFTRKHVVSKKKSKSKTHIQFSIPRSRLVFLHQDHQQPVHLSLEKL